jgi:hypothetical protein
MAIKYVDDEADVDYGFGLGCAAQHEEKQET